MQGSGTKSILVLAMLSQIAQDKQNVIFALDEPEVSIPPYTQKRIVDEIRKLSSQTFFASHSPYVLEEFEVEETVALSRNESGKLLQKPIEIPRSIKYKRYRREFRTRFCEGLVSRRILVVEGTTEAFAMPAVARRLNKLCPDKYSSLEMLGICVIDAGGESQISALAKLYGNMEKKVFAVCDEQTVDNMDLIAEEVEELFMHNESGFENLIINNTKMSAIGRFIHFLGWPENLKKGYPDPEVYPTESAEEILYRY